MSVEIKASTSSTIKFTLFSNSLSLSFLSRDTFDPLDVKVRKGGMGKGSLAIALVKVRWEEPHDVRSSCGS